MFYAVGSRGEMEVGKEDRSGRVVTKSSHSYNHNTNMVIFVLVCKYNKRLMVREFMEMYGKSAVS